MNELPADFGKKNFPSQLFRAIRRVLSTMTEQVIDQFRYIKIQPQTIGLSTRLWGINTEFVGFIPQNLVLKSIVWDWILIYRNWSIPRCCRDLQTKAIMFWKIRASSQTLSPRIIIHLTRNAEKGGGILMSIILPVPVPDLPQIARSMRPTLIN